VDIAVAVAQPVLERDGQLETAGDLFQEILFVDLQEFMERPYRRYGRFAHAHGTDLFRLHQCNVQEIPELVRQRGRRHPPRRAATGDDNFPDSVRFIMQFSESSSSNDAKPAQRFSSRISIARSSRDCISSMGPSRRLAAWGICSPAR
jgi:hypothetical protein